ncbi:MAG: hypothetical protein IKC75_07375 [Clostridia bacterium]|nr:hypothetical protein [Clostridia bacterium]
MSLWNRVCAKTQKAFAVVGEKTEELASAAAKALKIKSLEMKLDEQYEKLGELVYRDCHVDDDLEEERLAIIAAIDALFDEIALLKSEDEDTKTAECEE